ncbi:hypothetical protein BS47DRAFT_1338369 [Hydnum rufescens UP504]|uniref:Uncharacterized protein n=1 Tax=Hydnum rufescens UP504 TaxID=1448309 RepID=A0A9P6B6I6_9AGAM|nr:hypothetical protein BS47DRAFT_1338369 [Hydnum rufescens UP504]
MYRALCSTAIPFSGLATSTSLSETARIKLGLVNNDDEDETETSVDDEFTAYITAKRTPLNKPAFLAGARAYPTHMVPTCYGLSANSGILRALPAHIFF